MALLRNPIRALVGKSAGAMGQSIHSVSIVEMRPAEARRWHGLVQPVIQNNYVSSTSTASGRVRADWAWNWPRLRARAGLYNLLGSVARWGYVRSLCVVVDGPMHKAVPIGMLAAVPNLETTAFGVTEGRAFTWYLADAPKELYTGVLGMPVLQDVARVLIDCSIQLALDGGYKGSLILHASPAGGTRLQQFYRSLGMQQLPSGAGAVTPLRFLHSTDEYFLFDDVQAAAFCGTFGGQR
ncbi:Uncharacterised protein [Achromobacter xylosoxidans]|nr:Uncharacterised protein [Achromobacter xylosoxidans]CUJ34164.1 Uncharacterised protein [Achromobacter xylosoxidans]SQG76278.1 Uncharacterised protein [Achromobacter xylosoxidans]